MSIQDDVGKESVQGDEQKDRFTQNIRDEIERQKDRVYGHPLFRPLLEEIGDLHDRKNKQYASDSDPLGNFRRGGEMCKSLFKKEIQDNPFKLQMAYALVLVTKQIDGAMEILAYGKENTPDTLKEKLRDVITYFCILDCIDSDRLSRCEGAQSKTAFGDDDLHDEVDFDRSETG